MDVRVAVLLIAGVTATSAWAAPGEKGGAYGGGTTGEASEFTFKEADGNGDGVISPQEARLMGIERFDRVDKNGDGVLDEAEIAALETATVKGSSPDAASGNQESGNQTSGHDRTVTPATGGQAADKP